MILTISLPQPYQQSIEEVAESLGTDLRYGLAAGVAQSRLEAYGRNELPPEKAVPAWRRFLAQFQNVLVALLLVAAVISILLWVYERDTALPYEGLTILAVVLLNALMGYVQETRAEATVAALRSLSPNQATVLRDGARLRLAAAELVPGDVVLLEEGDTIAADGRVIESIALHVAEAALTGESLPVSKDTRTIDEEAALGDRTNMVFSSTTVSYGRGRAIVTATGTRTEIGRIARMLDETPAARTPLQRELDHTGKLLGVIVMIIAVVMTLVIVLMEDVHGAAGFFDVLILGVALAVAAVPEGLPTVVTAVLAIGVQRMAGRNAIVRNLAAVETLGSASIIASDKTGTLTRNEMTARVVVTASGRLTFDGSGYDPSGGIRRDGGGAIDSTLRAELERALAAADRANNARVMEKDGRWSVQGDPTEGALLVAARKAGLPADVLEARFPRIGELPFSSERKLMSTLHRDLELERVLVFSKGAPDVLLHRCTMEFLGEDIRPLTLVRRAELLRINEELAASALRTLAVAARPLPAATLHGEQLEEELVFAGLIGLLDPPRAEAGAAVGRAYGAGIRPIMITGDHPRTAVVIAEELGIQGDRALTGAQLDQVSDDELRIATNGVSVFARVNPEHKLRIVKALKSRGAVVAMTGDGVNDAPALKAADIGIAMGIAGTDVAKAAADMVLADDNFATIVAAVEEGRAIFANIRKFLQYLLSSNIGEVMTMFFGVLLAQRIGLGASESGVVLPLLATQILWINLVTDSLPALALAVDPPGEDLMNGPPRPAGEPVITRQMWRNIVFVGAIMAVGTLVMLAQYGRTMAFTTLVLFQLFNVFNARAEERSAFANLFSNWRLWVAVAIALAFQVAVIYTPFLQQAFDTVAMTGADWMKCVVVASSVLWLREISKVLARDVARG